jgi:hypothetical protein
LEAVGKATQALTGTPFYYLRCNNTDWNVSETSRLKPTGDAQLLTLSVNVRTVSDQCSVTEVIANAPDSWGTSQTYFVQAGANIPVPGSLPLVPNVNQVTFNVRYPATGSYAASFNPATNTVAFAPSSTIEGRVELAAGAGVAGTIVSVAGPSGGVVGTAVTNANGAYLVSGLAPASYTVSFAATRSGTQPSYAVSGTQPLALLGGTVSLDATCTPTTVGCTAGPPVNDPFHQLFIVDPNVTNPSLNPQASNAADGHFSFRYVLETLSGCPNAATNTSCVSNFIKSWLNNLGTTQVIDGFTVPPRMSSVVLGNWPTTSDGTTLDPAQAPFPLLAIVNRTDLHSTGRGEGRLVYGFQEGGSFQGVFMTVIVEFLLPATPALPTRNAWASEFFALPVNDSKGAEIACASSANPECAFGFNLQTLTDQFISAAQLLDFRTNEFNLTPPFNTAQNPLPFWAWRQFVLGSSGGLNALVTSADPETPDFTLNGDPSGSVGAFVNPNAAQIRDGFISVPSSLVGGVAFDIAQTSWSFPSLDATTAKSFAGRTCNGCHTFIGTDPTDPTAGGPTFHVTPTIATGDGTNILSPFVKLVEIPRRASFMANQITCAGAPSTCAAGVDVALTQF